jgi:chorismate dehydratase|tara:strand:+ start:253 stop:1047 length:795 start_codon:yes stop_codon:yes gene_type:complete
MSWDEVLGRVSFTNCDPIFHGLEDKWKILPAPPSWLTGHVLRQDCLTAPIPTADYAEHCEELDLIPDLGIVSAGNVGSVLLFGSRPIESMRDIALPSDSSTSKVLLRWVLQGRGLDCKFVELGPDIDAMLSNCDGALLIGDRALTAARSYPELVRLDLGYEWTTQTGLPMVFGVFATRKDSPVECIRKAHSDMLQQYKLFHSDVDWKLQVVKMSANKLGFSESRISRYFENEVGNYLDADAIMGLELFLTDVCGMEKTPTWIQL